MASLLSYPHLLCPIPRSIFSSRFAGLGHLSDRTQFHFFSRSPLSGRRCREYEVATLSFGAHQPDFESAEGFTRELLTRVEGILYTLADASISSSSSSFPVAAEEVSKQSSDWLSGITNSLETILKILKDGLSALHIPYAYGFAIIILTLLVKAVTFPLTKKQIESTLAMKSLQPQVKAIQQLYAGDQERIQIETARLYKLAGVNPLAGCLPTLATIPVWIGLYRALTNVANEGLLNEGFFWIPSLAGPTTVAARQSGSGTSWLFPFIDGHPPLGWSDTFAYLVLPVLLVVSQYISAQIMQSSQDSDPSQKSSQAVLKLLPLMIGYFALSVPSGLSLYWFTNNILSTAQQIWLQKLGGAKNPVKQFGDGRMDETSSILKSLSDMQSSTLAENKEVKSSVLSGSSVPSRGERFKQIKEEEARRRKLREDAGSRAAVESKTTEQSEAGVSSTYIEKKGAGAEVKEKMNDENSGNHQINEHLSNKTNGFLRHSSVTVKLDESCGEEEIKSEEMHTASALPSSSASESVDKIEETVEKDEV